VDPAHTTQSGTQTQTYKTLQRRQSSHPPPQIHILSPWHRMLNSSSSPMSPNTLVESTRAEQPPLVEDQSQDGFVTVQRKSESPKPSAYTTTLTKQQPRRRPTSKGTTAAPAVLQPPSSRPRSARRAQDTSRTASAVTRSEAHAEQSQRPPWRAPSPTSSPPQSLSRHSTQRSRTTSPPRTSRPSRRQLRRPSVVALRRPGLLPLSRPAPGEDVTRPLEENTNPRRYRYRRTKQPCPSRWDKETRYAYRHPQQ
jgi:hypothetical protein